VARAYTKRTKIISAQGGYHGHTGLALAAGDEKYRSPFGPSAPGFVQIPFGDTEAFDAVADTDTAACGAPSKPMGLPAILASPE
jgi:acetylornithine/succinyldiaminopimelate/putrescine aminotransferase